ncbi:MAG: hypothetical protein UX75_C0036G0003 [Candidatus Moranbacteria bacterium GW2011_GWE2_47_10]|nr:MAG: hypothetical protein UX75_C0036G0003 [Candidatus Moranbacteria bacterium GW2011_GWE2_47_10]
MLITFKQKSVGGYKYADRQNTKWSEITRKCKHKWQPLQMQINEHGTPDLNSAKIYCVCMKCCAYTYIEAAFIGYYVNSPDDLEAKC